VPHAPQGPGALRPRLGAGSSKVLSPAAAPAAVPGTRGAVLRGARGGYFAMAPDGCALRASGGGSEAPLQHARAALTRNREIRRRVFPREQRAWPRSSSMLPMDSSCRRRPHSPGARHDQQPGLGSPAPPRAVPQLCPRCPARCRRRHELACPTKRGARSLGCERLPGSIGGPGPCWGGPGPSRSAVRRTRMDAWRFGSNVSRAQQRPNPATLACGACRPTAFHHEGALKSGPRGRWRKLRSQGMGLARRLNFQSGATTPAGRKRCGSSEARRLWARISW
jgi:hypothetical protein